MRVIPLDRDVERSGGEDPVSELPLSAVGGQPAWGTCLRPGFDAALPVMLGYAAIGLPCGVLCDSVGLGIIQVLMLSVLFYSGAGQFMIPNMYMAGNPIISLITSVSLVNTRQMLYSASLAPRCEGASKPLSFLFTATVTDESYGVYMTKYDAGPWSVREGLVTNLFCQSSWTLFNVVGVVIGGLVDIPLPIAAFAMTSIFICLLFTQPASLPNIASAIIAIAGVFVCKVIGLAGASILLGALAGVAGGLVIDAVTGRMHRREPMGAGHNWHASDGKGSIPREEGEVDPDGLG